MVSLSQDIFRELSKNEQCLQALQSRLVPTLLSILNQDPQKLPGGESPPDTQPGPTETARTTPDTEPGPTKTARR